MVANLRKLRMSAGISQKALADAVGVSQQSINRYENHSVEPDIGMLIRLADYFGTSVDNLIGHTGVVRPSGPTRPYELNEEESQLLDSFRRLNRRQKESVGMIVETYLER